MKAAERLRAFTANIDDSTAPERAGASPAVTLAPQGGRHQGVSRVKGALELPLDRLVADPAQPRREFEPESLERLARSLRTRGQLQPIRVRWDETLNQWMVVTGERRFRAAQLAGLATLACVETEQPLSPDEVLEDQLTENCLRDDLLPMEQARAFRALMERRGWSQRQLAEHLAMAPSTVSRVVALLELPDDIQEDVEGGKITPDLAYEIGKEKDPDERARLTGEARAGRLSRDQARGNKERGYRVRYPVRGGHVAVTLASAAAAHDDVVAALAEALKKARGESRGAA